MTEQTHQPEETPDPIIDIDGPLDQASTTEIDRILAAIRSLTYKLDRVQTPFLERIEEMTDRMNAVCDPINARIAELENAVTRWAEENRTDKVKKWDLPSGKIRTRESKPYAKVVDLELVPEEWTEQVSTIKPLTGKIKAHFAESGEVLPGCEIIPAKISATIQTTWDNTDAED